MGLKCEFSTDGDILQFEELNLDLRLEDSTGLIHIAKVYGRLTVFIEVKENTTARQLRKAEGLALALRQKLLDHQGPWVRGGDTELYYKLDRISRGRGRYVALAHDLNQSFYRSLREYARYTRAYEAVKCRFKTWGDFYNWSPPPDSNSYGLWHAKRLLLAMGIKEKKADEIAQSCLQYIQDPEYKDPSNYPIDNNRVKNKLKTWRRSGKYQALRRLEPEEDDQ